MKIYLVGGAVRDELLHIPHKEKDWVVVGATVEEMLKLGFRPVGKDFPVFLHPETHEEYALARTERKVGKGYKGFIFNADPSVTLEEDLKRRDLTINAIAKMPEGELIDPYQGKADIENKVLRHVSLAFAEDPVRILRVGRFLARYASLGFIVADETYALMKQMVAAREVDALVPERVWKEWERALGEKNPEKFFEVLENCGAMSALFGENNRLLELGRDFKNEIKSHNNFQPLNMDFEALKRAAQHIDTSKEVRFAVLLNQLSADQLFELCERYRVPSDYRDLAVLVVRFKNSYSNLEELTTAKIVDLLYAIDAFRREERFKMFLLSNEILFNTNVYSFQLKKYYNAAKEIKPPALVLGLSGKEVGEKIRQERIRVIDELRHAKTQ